MREGMRGSGCDGDVTERGGAGRQERTEGERKGGRERARKGAHLVKGHHRVPLHQLSQRAGAGAERGLSHGRNGRVERFHDGLHHHWQVGLEGDPPRAYEGDQGGDGVDAGGVGCLRGGGRGGGEEVVRVILLPFKRLGVMMV